MFKQNIISDVNNTIVTSRFISHDYSKKSSISALKSALDLCPLSERTNISRLVTFHKLFVSPSSFRDLYLQPASYISMRIDINLKIGPLFPRTNKFKNSPLALAINHWNSFPRLFGN